MTVLSAILQGIIQGLTEFLPVSSSGHLSIYQYFSGQSGQEGFFLSIVLHAGTLVAVCICFFGEIQGLFGALFSFFQDISRPAPERVRTPEKRTLLCMILSCVPLLAGFFLMDWVSGFSTDNDVTVEGFCFMVTGILLLSSSKGQGRKTGDDITLWDALCIGMGQLFALTPGISRSGATVSVGRLRGLEREYAVSYSFILGIPTVLAAILLETAKAVEQGLDTPVHVLAAGFCTALVSGILAIRLVQWLVRGDKFKYFGYYTLVLGTVVLIVGFLR